MAFDPTLPTSRDRIRFALADTSDPPALPGGETGYNTLLTEYGGSEIAVFRSAARVLEGVYAKRASSLSSGGEGLSYAVERVTFYRRIADGSTPWPLMDDTSTSTTSNTGGVSVVTPVW